VARYRILVPRLIDAANRNAQNLNAKAMLARFDDPSFEWHVFYYGTPDLAVMRNPSVVPHRLWRGRLWPWQMIAHYAQGYDAVFYPGSEWYDAIGVALFKRRFPERKLITTLEGIRGNEAREAFLSGLFGQTVYCDRREEKTVQRFDAVRNLSDRIIAISPFLESVSHALYSAETRVLPLGFEPLHVRDIVPARSTRRPLIVSAGTVYARKRPDAFLNLAKSHPDADFVWYGEGPMRPALSERIADEDIRNLGFPGEVAPDALGSAFSDADIFVLPSHAEGVPKVSLEAAAHGLPVVLYGFYESPTVRDGETGYYVYSDEEMRARVCELLDDLTLAQRLGQAGRALANELDWDKIAHQWLATIRALLTNEPTHSSAVTETM